MTQPCRVPIERRSRSVRLVLMAGLLILGAGACGSDAERPGSLQTTTATGSNGPGSTTGAGTTGSSPTFAPRPSFAPGESGVTGIVGQNPCPPGDLRGCDARPEPVAATVIVTDRDSHAEVARAKSATTGRYAIRVAAGAYRLDARTDTIGLSCTPVDIVVSPGSYADANIECQ
jgi:hypothetical protein